jgi:hypothetical protein
LGFGISLASQEEKSNRQKAMPRQRQSRKRKEEVFIKNRLEKKKWIFSAQTKSFASKNAQIVWCKVDKKIQKKGINIA